MGEQIGTNGTTPDRTTADEPKRPVTHQETLAAGVPVRERDRPDPMLETTGGRVGASGITLAALIAALVLAVVIYGLNSPSPATQDVGNPRAALSNPAVGGKGLPPGPSPQRSGNAAPG